MKISEKQLEDYLFENPNELSDLRCNAVSLGRQVDLPHGIADLVIYDGQGILVVELKAVPPKPKDVCQILRYTYDIRMYVELVSFGMMAADETGRVGWYFETGKSVKPILVAKGYDEHIAAAMEAAGGLYIAWDYDNKFEFVAYGAKTSEYYEIFPLIKKCVSGEIDAEVEARDGF